jgi:signal peptidase
MRTRFGPAICLLAWLYLTVVASLGLWVGATRVIFHWTPVVVTSSSMAPKLQPGDVVMLTPSKDARPDVGNLIRFRAADGGTVLHRVERVMPDGSYQTKGDANATPDPHHVLATEITGVGRLLVPVIGRPWLWRAEGQVATVVVWLAVTAGAAFLAFRPLVQPRRERRGVPVTSLPSEAANA